MQNNHNIASNENQAQNLEQININNNNNNNISPVNMNMSEIKSFISSKEGEIKSILLQKISLLENELSTSNQKK